MVLLSQKLGLSHKPPSKDHHHSLAVFRSNIADFIAQTFLNNRLKPVDDAPALLSLVGFQKCFQLITFTNRALAQMVAEMDYPMTRWGAKSTEEYLSYSLNLLDVLNSITSSLSHLNQARVSILHSLVSNHFAGNKNLLKISVPDTGKDFKLEDSITVGMDGNKVDTDKEFVVVQALRVSKKVEFLALGFVLSGLCSHPKPYLEMRKLCLDGFKDSTLEGLDLRLCKEVGEAMLMEDLREINRGIDGVSVEEMKGRLKVMENAIKAVEKAANDMFYDVLGRRNKLLDNIRLTCKK